MILRSDVIVIGAGPAGCSAALYLARYGFRVILADKARFPRPKACGEGVMPAGLSVLEELGVLPEVEKAGKRYLGIQFENFRGKRAVGRFPEGRHGIAIRRDTLDWILLQKAKTTPDIQVLESVRIARPILENGKLCGWKAAYPAPYSESALDIHAPHTLVADGSGSAAARMLDLKRAPPPRKRYGMRTHFDGIAGLKDLVEVYFLDGAEIYMAPQGQGNALVSILAETETMRRFAGRTQEAFAEILGSCLPLKERMSRAVRTSAIIGAGPLGGSAEKWHGPGWLLVGDSASSVDPITGEGISLALLNGKLAAGQLASGKDGRDYDRERRRLVRKKKWLAQALLGAARHPLLCDWMIAGLSRRPKAFRYFLSSY